MSDESDPAFPSAAELAAVHSLYPELIDRGGKFIRREARNREEREVVTEEEKAAALKDRAVKWTQDLINTIPAIERVTVCAPPPRQYKRRKRETNEFDPRFATFIETRHRPFIDVVDGKLGEVAHHLGFAQTYANTIRAELILLSLTRGEIPPWAVIDGRKKYKCAHDEGLLCAAIFPILWEANERALTQAEHRGLTRDPSPPTQLRSKRAELLAEFFQTATTAKTVGQFLSIRGMFKILGRIIDEFRREITT